jgi:hypothetical protein
VQKLNIKKKKPRKNRRTIAVILQGLTRPRPFWPRFRALSPRLVKLFFAASLNPYGKKIRRSAGRSEKDRRALSRAIALFLAKMRGFALRAPAASTAPFGPKAGLG